LRRHRRGRGTRRGAPASVPYRRALRRLRPLPRACWAVSVRSSA